MAPPRCNPQHPGRRRCGSAASTLRLVLGPVGVSAGSRGFATRTIGELGRCAADVRAPDPMEVGSVSVIPVPAAPEQPEPAEASARPLRLVTHEHAWELRAVEYDDAFEVRRYECAGCDDVMYR